MRELLEVGAEARVEGVRIVLSTRVATFNLRARTAGGEPLRHAAVTLVPSDPARWTRSEAQLFCATDGDGACTVNGAPGEYLVFMLPPGVPSSTIRKDEVGERAARVPRVALRAGERRTFEVIAPAGN